jgi:hypothetical protein
VLRWQLEVTLQEARRHFGVENQWPWSDLAIRRTTSVLPGLCSLMPMAAHARPWQGAGHVRLAERSLL